MVIMSKIEDKLGGGAKHEAESKLQKRAPGQDSARPSSYLQHPIQSATGRESGITGAAGAVPGLASSTGQASSLGNNASSRGAPNSSQPLTNDTHKVSGAGSARGLAGTHASQASGYSRESSLPGMAAGGIPGAYPASTSGVHSAGYGSHAREASNPQSTTSGTDITAGLSGAEGTGGAGYGREGNKVPTASTSITSAYEPDSNRSQQKAAGNVTGTAVGTTGAGDAGRISEEDSIMRLKHGGISNGMAETPTASHSGSHSARENYDAVPTAGGQKVGSGVQGPETSYGQPHQQHYGGNHGHHVLHGHDGHYLQDPHHTHHNVTIAGGADRAGADRAGAAGPGADELGKEHAHRGQTTSQSTATPQPFNQPSASTTSVYQPPHGFTLPSYSPFHFVSQPRYTTYDSSLYGTHASYYAPGCVPSPQAARNADPTSAANVSSINRSREHPYSSEQSSKLQSSQAPSYPYANRTSSGLSDAGTTHEHSRPGLPGDHHNTDTAFAGRAGTTPSAGLSNTFGLDLTSRTYPTYPTSTYPLHSSLSSSTIPGITSSLGSSGGDGKSSTSTGISSASAHNTGSGWSLEKKLGAAYEAGYRDAVTHMQAEMEKKL